MKSAIFIISLISIGVIISGCIGLFIERSGAYEMEYVHISLFTRDGSPSIVLEKGRNDSFYQMLSNSSFILNLEITNTDFNIDYSFIFNNDTNNPKLVPSQIFYDEMTFNAFYDFEFDTNYTFQISLIILSQYEIIKDLVFFGEDNIVQGNFITYDERYDQLEYSSQDFKFEYRNHMGSDKVFKITEELYFRIGDGGISSD